MPHVYADQVYYYQTRVAASTVDLNTATWGNWCTVTSNATITTTATVNDWTWTRWNQRAGFTASYIVQDEVTQWMAPEASQRMGLVREEREQRAQEATERARELLRGLLTEEQWQEYDDHETFTVIGSSGQRFRIDHGTTGNVTTVDSDGYPLVAYCAHPELYDQDSHRYLPTEDVLVAQALALMTDDAAFLAVANVHRSWEPRREELAA